jgi:hypothetical protein
MKYAFLAGLLLILCAVMVSAQNSSLDFKMTTSFNVENTKLPAGSYTIRVIDEGALELSNASGAPSILINPDPLDSPSGQANLKFAKYNDRLYLKQIDFPGGMSYWIPMTADEKTTRKKSGKPTQTAVKPNAK